MTWRSLHTLAFAGCWIALAACQLTRLAAEDDPPANSDASVEYISADSPTGEARAVVVDGHPLVHTRQFLPLDSEGKLVGEGSADEQIEQVLTNLSAVLENADSGLDQLVRLNIYALSHETADRLRDQLTGRIDAAVCPAMTTILTPLPHRKALVAVDAVAYASGGSDAVTLARCEEVAGEQDCADVGVLPPGGVAYLSGQPEQGGLAASAVTQSLSILLDRLKPLNLSSKDVVRLKVFLKPASSADAALREIKRLFPGQLTPPVVFVEWIASVPVEIELIARLPLADQSQDTVEYYNPPGLKASPAFSRVALVHTERQIYISALCGRDAGNGETQARDVFEQLDSILAETGSDIRHLAKATYYVSEDDGSRGIDILRREVFDPERPPAASKVTVHAVGRPDRNLSIDMIAVGTEAQRRNR